jgi:hypothetical protein
MFTQEIGGWGPARFADSAGTDAWSRKDYFLVRKGSEARGTKPQYRFPGMGEGGSGQISSMLWWELGGENFFLGGWRDWGFDEGFLCYDDKMIAC